jgi:REP element-mobilizing transposase RayT
LEGPGYWFHVTGRGNARGKLFLDGSDRRRFVELLSAVESRYGLEVHGYVLMSNHYHLLLRMKQESGLSAGMQWLGVSYTVWFNRRHRRSGHLLEGRFKAILVEFDTRGAALSRYLHLNPVRMRRYGLDKRARAAERVGVNKETTSEMVRERLKALSSYPWSSYRNYFQGKGPSWLHREAILSRFGRGARSRALYRRYVEEAIRSGHEESPLEEVKAGFVLGGEEFLEEIRARIRGDAREQPGLKEIVRPLHFEDIVRVVSNHKGENWDEYSSRRGDWGRDMVLLLARENTMMTNRELAERAGGIDDSAVAQAVRRLTRRIQENASLTRTWRALQKVITQMS